MNQRQLTRIIAGTSAIGALAGAVYFYSKYNSTPKTTQNLETYINAVKLMKKYSFLPLSKMAHQERLKIDTFREKTGRWLFKEPNYIDQFMNR